MTVTTTRTTPETAYRALSSASEQIGTTQFMAQHSAHLKAGRSRSTFRYCPTPIHRTIVDMMPDVLVGRVTVEDAFAFVTRPDVMAERFGKGGD